MKKILVIILLAACKQVSFKPCEGKILDLTIDSLEAPNNSILEFSKDDGFIEIRDTSDLLQVAKLTEFPYYLQASERDPSKRKYTLRIKRAIVKTSDYEIDVLMRKDNDIEGDAVLYWLKSYDNKRNQVGHLDFSAWSYEGWFISGRIDCDTTLHVITWSENKTFKVDNKGMFNCINCAE